MRVDKRHLGVLTGVFAMNTCVVAQADKPNVILILMDDWGYHQMGCYGSDFYETPNLDRLASEGMRFTNAYAAAAISSPTRAALMSGKYPARLHLTNWIPGQKEPESTVLSMPDWTKSLGKDDIVLPQKMQSHGYRTSLIGKWHVGQWVSGWDEVYKFEGPKKGQECDGTDCHRVKEYTDSALLFIKRNADAQQPFFCFLSHNAIHTPEYEDANLIAKYKKKAGALKGGYLNPVQGAMVERVDQYTGILLDSLKQWKLEENTLLIVLADNGQYSPKEKRGASPLRGAKGSLWEGGCREPLLVRWKGKIKAGSICEESVITHDILPTLSVICGFSLADVNDIDGKSFADNLLVDPQLKIDRQYLCWHYPHWHPQGEFQGSIRQGDWKLIEDFNKSMYYLPDAFELYNLKDDMSESRNLINKRPEKAAELYANLLAWRTEVKAQLPVVKHEITNAEKRRKDWLLKSFNNKFKGQ